MSRSLRSRIPETVAPSTRVCVSINLSIYLSIYHTVARGPYATILARGGQMVAIRRPGVPVQ